MTSEPFTIATFNVHHGRGRDGHVDLRRTAAVISKMTPDLLALQELDVGMQRSDRVDQPSVLGELIGMTIRFFPTLASERGQYGIGLAARDQLECKFEELPGSADDEPRIAIVARWRALDIVATHLSRSDEARALQTEALVAIAGDLPGPTIVMGDLNQRERHLDPLTAAGLSIARPRVPLGWLLRPHPRVDHILMSSGLGTRRARLVPTRASDHSAVVAELTRGT